MAAGLFGKDSPGIRAVCIRFCGSLFIVISTYNPSGWSLVHWFGDAWPEKWHFLLPISSFYALAYLLMIRTTFRSLRLGGMGLALAFMGAIAWVLVDAGVIELADASDLLVVLLYMAGGLLAAGMSWVPLWTRLTGQVSVDDLTA